MLEPPFENRWHLCISNQLAGDANGVIQMFVIGSDHHSAAERLLPHQTDLPPLFHNGLASLIRTLSQFRLVNLEVQAL